MNDKIALGVPRWIWFTLAGLTVGSLAGVAYFATRSPAYDRMLLRTGAPKEILILGAIQRYTESRGNAKAGLGRPELFPWWAEPRNAPRDVQIAESKAAADGYEYNIKSYGESPYPKPMWIFGSGGPYGLLPSTALAPWRHTDEMRRGKVTPYDVFNPWRATVFFVDYVYRQVQRQEFREMAPEDRTILALKRSLASPKLLTDVEEIKGRSRVSRQKAADALESLGRDPDDLYIEMPLAWPNYIGARELLK